MSKHAYLLLNVGVITRPLILCELPAPSLQGPVVSPRRGSCFRAFKDTSELLAFLLVFVVQVLELEAI